MSRGVISRVKGLVLSIFLIKESIFGMTKYVNLLEMTLIWRRFGRDGTRSNRSDTPSSRRSFCRKCNYSRTEF